ncbi:3'-5' exonuclease [Tateyamaria omphalii]|uniref:DNA-directed DNA polymerase n=1 Tax=Tateyamaria omphalii TaxID=299262 RepID=A0A1P8N1N7_9RHOB|nr:3'-5' exonuclease [Tateyamaria omphalii]APX14231.1 DNA polymerase III subunit epsilon [Tateyamaria omphalii]
MLTRLSLRLRIFLFFCLMAAGGAVLAGGALYFGWARAEGALPGGPFVTAFVLFAFLNTGLAAVVWLLFDENVAKPINALAAELRLRAHSGVAREVDGDAARYLGDLAPAAQAVSQVLSSSVMDSATEVAHKTARLQAEAERLTALLTEIPVATIMVNERMGIVLYDGQAAEILAGIAPPRLKAPLVDYFYAADLGRAKSTMNQTAAEVAFDLRDKEGGTTFAAKFKPLDGAGYMLLIEMPEEPMSPEAARPLVYDFDLLNAGDAANTQDTALSELCFVAFDSETTGLSTTDDDVVQLGAVRILNGRIVEGEVLDSYVNPGRPIPPASTAVHHVSDVDVAGAPDFATAGRALHGFCRDAVLVAHNAPFDIAFLRRGAGAMGVTWDHPVLDTVLLSAIVFGTTEEHTLDALCDRLDITILPEMRHTALGDAQVTAEALVRLIPLLEGKGLRTLRDVIAESKKHGRLLQDLN